MGGLPHTRSAAAALAVALGLAVSTVSHSALAQEPAECRNPGSHSQSQMNHCAAARYELADKELNRVYRLVRNGARALDREYAEMGPNYTGAENALIQSQRGWIAYRDGTCTLAGFEARGGTMEPLLVSGCMRQLTELRTNELRRMLKDFMR